MAQRNWARSGKSHRGAAKVPREQTRVTSESRRRQLPERPSVHAVLLHLEVQGLGVGPKAWRTQRIAREPESPGDISGTDDEIPLMGSGSRSPIFTAQV